MQHKSKRNSTFVERLQKIRLAQNWTWEEVAKQIGLSRSMLHFIRQGKYGVTDKVQYRLENVETEAGIKPENPLVKYAVIENSEPTVVERFGSRLRFLRDRTGLSLQEFSKKCGVSTDLIEGLESGSSVGLTEEFIEKVASLFGVSSGWLTLGEGLMTNEAAGRIQDQRADFPSLQTLTYDELSATLRHFEKQTGKQKGYLRQVYQEFLTRIISELMRRAQRGEASSKG